MSRPVLYIHAGSHKTGTTAIQQALLAAAQELRSQGVCWPILRTNLAPAKAHSKLVRLVYADDPLSRLRGHWLASSVRRQARGAATTVLSSEKIYRIGYEFFENAEQDTPGNRERRIAFLRRLRGLFAEQFDVRVLLYLRRVDDFAESMYKELLFRKPYAGRFLFERFLVEQRALFDFGAQIRELQANLGPVSVHSYHAACEVGLVEHFCGLIGATLPAQPGRGPRVRRSASNTAALFLERLSAERALTHADRLLVLEFSVSGQMPSTGSGSRSLWPTRESLESFMRQNCSPELDGLFPAIDWGALRFGPLDDREFQASLAAFEDWRRNAASSGAGSAGKASPDTGTAPRA